MSDYPIFPMTGNEQSPFAPPNLVAYRKGDKILVINPGTRRWLITNEVGLRVIELCDGTNSPESIAAKLNQVTKVVHPNLLEIVNQCLPALRTGGIVFDAQSDYDSIADVGCICDGPDSIHLEITNQCNLPCRHCYVSAGHKMDNELSFQEITNIINDFRTVCTSPLPLVGITGGEARLRSDCLDILRHARSAGFAVKLLTNAVGMDHAFAEELARLSAWVQISLDGPNADTNDRIRGKGSFEKILEGTEILLEHGLSAQMVLFVTLTAHSIHNALELIDYAEQKGIAFIHFSQLNKQGRAIAHWDNMAPDVEQWIRFGEALQSRPKSGTVIKGNPFGGLAIADGFPKMTCKLPSSIRIDCVGNVYPCQLFVGSSQSIGNIRTSSLSEILKGNTFHQLQTICSERASNIDKCFNCDWEPLCGGGCPGHAYSEFNTYDHEDSLCDVRLYWFEHFAELAISA